MSDNDIVVKDNNNIPLIFQPEAKDLGGGVRRPMYGMQDGAFLSFGAQADVAATADTGTFSFVALFKRSLATLTSIKGLLSGTLTTQTVLSDTRPVSSNITVADTGTVTTSTGQNGSVIITGIATAGSFSRQSINGVATARYIVTGTWTGSLQFEGSTDGGSTFVPIPARVVGTSYIQSVITGNGNFLLDVAGFTDVRLRAVTFSGTSTVQTTFSQTPGITQILNPLRLVDNTNGNVAVIKGASTAALASDPALVVGISPNSIVQTPIPALIYSGQQTTTTAAAALPSQALVNGAIIKALGTNVSTVYVGPAGVTTSNGYPLGPGEAISYATSNLSLIYIIGQNTSDKVAFTGN